MARADVIFLGAVFEKNLRDMRSDWEWTRDYGALDPYDLPSPPYSPGQVRIPSTYTFKALPLAVLKGSPDPEWDYMGGYCQGALVELNEVHLILGFHSDGSWESVSYDASHGSFLVFYRDVISALGLETVNLEIQPPEGG